MISTPINYPEQLPYPQRDGYSMQGVAASRSTTLTSGRTRQRQIYSDVPAEASVTWVFKSDGEAQLFQGWVKHTLKGGSLWFNGKLKTPMGVGRYICRIKGGEYSGPDPVGLCAWQSSATLELFEQPVISADLAEFPEFVVDFDIIDVAVNEKWPA